MCDLAILAVAATLGMSAPANALAVAPSCTAASHAPAAPADPPPRADTPRADASRIAAAPPTICVVDPDLVSTQ